MNKFSSLLFMLGLSFLLMVITFQLPLGQAPMLVGQHILANAVNDTGAANIVTSVVLAYRGLDTLGELSILFAAASAVGLILNTSVKNKEAKLTLNAPASDDNHFIVQHAIDLLFPLLIIVGLYVILHGHLTPGGGFQGGVIIAVAFFMQILANPEQNSNSLSHDNLSLIESFSGAIFILIGLYALITGHSFLEPLMIQSDSSHSQLGNLWSAGTLPMLYLAVGLKVGAELSSLLMTLYESSTNEAHIGHSIKQNSPIKNNGDS